MLLFISEMLFSLAFIAIWLFLGGIIPLMWARQEKRKTQQVTDVSYFGILFGALFGPFTLAIFLIVIIAGVFLKDSDK